MTLHEEYGVGPEYVCVLEQSGLDALDVNAGRNKARKINASLTRIMTANMNVLWIIVALMKRGVL